MDAPKAKSEITRARLEELKAKHKKLKQKEEDPKLEEEEEEIVVKFDYVATGSRDKTIIIWNA